MCVVSATCIPGSIHIASVTHITDAMPVASGRYVPGAICVSGNHIL